MTRNDGLTNGNFMAIFPDDLYFPGFSLPTCFPIVAIEPNDVVVRSKRTKIRATIEGTPP